MIYFRLDVESKIPETLLLSFVSCRLEEKPAALLCLMNHVIPKTATTIIFAATKHHVEYLHAVGFILLLVQYIKVSMHFVIYRFQTIFLDLPGL